MEHYTLNGYQLNHSTLSPSVKLYGIFDTLSDALNFLSSYMTQRCEQNDGGNRYLNGNGYRLWIKKIMNNNDLYVYNGIEMLSGGENIKIRFVPNFQTVEYNQDELSPHGP